MVSALDLTLELVISRFLLCSFSCESSNFASANSAKNFLQSSLILFKSCLSWFRRFCNSSTSSFSFINRNVFT